MTDAVYTREQQLNELQGDEVRGYIADNFAKYADPDQLGRFLMRYELFKRIINVHGSIVECGVKTGSGLLAWYNISKLLEPLNRRRIIYGFDTFDGLASIDHTRDHANAEEQSQRPFVEGGYQHLALVELQRCIHMAHQQMAITDFGQSGDKVFMRPRHEHKQVVTVVGDFMQTGEQFIADNKHLVVALLYLDFDLFAPTRRAMELFLERMPKGAIIAFDELDHPEWPGETLAAIEGYGIWKLHIERLPWIPTMGFAVLG